MNPDVFTEPLAFLIACHGRIRERLATFREVAGRLRDDAEVDRAPLEAALLFLRTSGAGHTIDEEGSLFPRLRPRLVEAGDHASVALLDRLLAEHREHDEVAAELAASLAALDPTLLEGDGLPDPEAPRLRGGTTEARRVAAALEALVVAYESHIPLEDDTLFPAAARVLPPEELSAIAAEFRSRRVLGRRLLGFPA